MAITEADRLFMHEGLRECMTEKVADLLMEHLPPTGWADVARVQDLHQLERNLEIRFGAIDTRFEAIDSTFDAIDSKFEAIETQFGAVRGEIASLEEKMNTKFESVDTRFENLTQMMNVQFSNINGRLDRMSNALIAIGSAGVVAYLSLIGIMFAKF